MALSWISGSLGSEFGRYQDEGMHYITGVFIQDYLTSGHWAKPMQFAQDYYLHFPKIALGNWPPGFSLMQVAWSLIFGVSRVSMLVGMAVLTAWLAWLVYRMGERYLGAIWGIFAALLLIAAPITQSQAAMVMAEIPLAAASLLAVEAFVRFLETSRRGDAIAFALWTFGAIMIKGNGWVIGLAAPAILLVTGNLRQLRNGRLWLAVLMIAGLCIPYTLVTMRIVSQGWDTRSFPGFPYYWASLGVHLNFVVGYLGWPLLAIGLLGAALPFFRKPASPFWKALTVYGAAIVIFHVAVPTSMEPRKLYQLMPVLCLWVVAGLDAIADAASRRLTLPYLRPAVAATGAALFFASGFALLPDFTPGIGPAVQRLLDNSATRGAAVLISSNPEWADNEAAFIAEWASRRRGDGAYLIRGTKLLSRPSGISAPGEDEFVLNYPTPKEVLEALASIPVSFVILHTRASRISYPHHELLRTALKGDPAEWELIDHTTKRLDGLRETDDIEVYRCRRNLAGIPIHYSVDLTSKVGLKPVVGQ